MLVWPNDLMFHGAKLAGILCTSRVSGNDAWTACGVGINVHRSSGGEQSIDPPPAYCDDVAPVGRPALLRSILLEYEATRETLNNTQYVARLWERRAGLPGRRYRILKDGESSAFDAIALSLATGGGLVVRRSDGVRETIALADARVLR